MAIIKCPECNHDVSSSAIACPYCGFAVKEETNDIIQIKIDPHPHGIPFYVKIKEVGTKKLLAEVEAGKIAEIKAATEIRISFCSGITGFPMHNTKVSPKNGGKYCAKWGEGMFRPSIEFCDKVDAFY